MFGDAGYWDHATGKLFVKMNMLDEHGERYVNFLVKVFVWDDLKRWGIAHINLTGRKLGRHRFGDGIRNRESQ